MNDTSTLKYGSLFTGVGGFDLAFDQAGYECCWQAEWDSNCQQTLAYHWPNVPLYSDVCDIKGADLEPVDIITYGSPCQDLSVAGKRAGIEGGRSSMFFEAVRIFKEMRDATDGVFPRITVWENVPGALSSNGGADFEAVLKALDDIGSLAQWWYVLDAQYFGVPQRRRRVFLVSVYDPAILERIGDAEILPVAQGRRGDSPASKSAGEGSAATIASGAGVPSVNRMLGFGHYIEDVTVSTIAQRDYKSATDLVVSDFVAFHPHYHDGARPQGDVINTVTSRWGTGGNNGTMIAQHYSFDTQFGSNANVFEDQSPTLKATQTSPTVATDTIIRRLTPIECERLMGWPDNHTLNRIDGKTNSASTRYKMCGNGVATPVAYWIASHLKAIL